MWKTSAHPRRAFWVTLLVLVLLAVFLLTFGADSMTRVLCVRNEGRYHLRASYALLDGTETKTVHAITTPDILHVEVETESGSLSIVVTDKKGNLVFSQESIPSSKIDVEIPGDVKLKITADHHKGSFYIHTRELS